MKILKILGIIISFTLIITGIQDYIISKNLSDIVVIICLCLFIVFLIYRLIKPKNKNKKKTSIKIDVKSHELNTPEHVKSDLRKYYNVYQIPNEIRIIEDCIQLAKTSNNINTVLERIELGTRKAFALKELEQAKIYNQHPTSDYFLTILLDNGEKLKLNAIKRSYDKLIHDCEKLKTDTGKQNKKQKYFEFLEENYYQFSNDTNDYIKNLKERKM